MANVNNSTNAASYITYRRATELNPCNEFVVMDLAVVISSKGEVPPHTFIKVTHTGITLHCTSLFSKRVS